MNAVHHVLSQHTVPSAYSISLFHISPPGRCCSTTGILQQQSSPGWVIDGCFSRGDLSWADLVQLVGCIYVLVQRTPSSVIYEDGMFYTRGSSDDFNRFADTTGDDGWSWDSIQQYLALVRQHKKTLLLVWTAFYYFSSFCFMFRSACLN